jgi:outer membrane protein TolC
MTGFREYFANGLKVGPDYRRPCAPVADTWIDYQDPRVISDPVVDWAWWRVFNDPMLDQLVLTAYQQNLTLREAGLRILEARAQRQIAVGNLFPQTQQLSGAYTRQQISQELGFGGQFAGSGGIPGAGGFGFGQNFNI